jgi:fructokinase
VAVALSRLDMSAGFMGKVGDDPFGEYLRACLESDGVEADHLYIDPQARTTAVFTAVRSDGLKDLCFYRNPGADMSLRPDDIPDNAFKGARCFHYGSIGLIDEPCASAQKKAMAMARDKGLMISFDPNYRPTLWPGEDMARSVIMEAYQHCHLAKISEEEWDVATGQQDLQKGIQAVLDQGVELVVISLGEKGSMASNGDYLVEAPAWQVEVVETTGAGDGFLAAMISQLLPERETPGFHGQGAQGKGAGQPGIRQRHRSPGLHQGRSHPRASHQA